MAKNNTLFAMLTGAALAGGILYLKKLGEKHLRGMALQAIKLDARPEPFFKNIQKAVTDFTGGIPQADDLTLMVISRYPKKA